MAGPVPAIPTGTGRENCATDRRYGGCGDGRDKPGHDGETIPAIMRTAEAKAKDLWVGVGAILAALLEA